MYDGADTGFNIAPSDSYFLPSTLSDAQATYLAAAIVFLFLAVMAWIRRKDLG